MQNKKEHNVVTELTAVLDEYNLWKSMIMFIADIMNVNTGRRNKIAIQLKRPLVQKKQVEFQFIVHQHHIT